MARIQRRTVATSLGNALPPGVPAQHIEACLGWGCGQCHNRSFGPDAVLPYTGPPPARAPRARASPRHSPRAAHVSRTH